MELKGTKLQHKLDWMVWHNPEIDNKKTGIQSNQNKFS
jgi:hypothetical protein